MGIGKKNKTIASIELQKAARSRWIAGDQQVISFSVEKVTRNAKNEVVKGGKIIVSLQWLNGPAKFMRKYASARPIQVYSAEDFIEQFVIVKQQKEAWSVRACPA